MRAGVVALGGREQRRWIEPRDRVGRGAGRLEAVVARLAQQSRTALRWPTVPSARAAWRRT